MKNPHPIQLTQASSTKFQAHCFRGCLNDVYTCPWWLTLLAFTILCFHSFNKALFQKHPDMYPLLKLWKEQDFLFFIYDCLQFCGLQDMVLIPEVYQPINNYSEEYSNCLCLLFVILWAHWKNSCFLQGIQLQDFWWPPL